MPIFSGLLASDNHSAIVADSVGNLYAIGFADNSGHTTGLVVVKSTDNGVTWSQLGSTVDTYSSDAKYPTIAIDSSDVPHIVYGNNLLAIVHYKYTGGIWGSETVICAPSVGSAGWDGSITLKKTSSGLVMAISANGYGLEFGITWGTYIFVYDGSSWDAGTYLEDSSTGNTGEWSSIIVDSAGNFHVAFLGYSSDPGSTSNRRVCYAIYSGGTWTISQISTIRPCYDVDITVDGSDNPHIVVTDFQTPNREVRHFYQSGGVWTSEVVASVDYNTSVLAMATVTILYVGTTSNNRSLIFTKNAGAGNCFVNYSSRTTTTSGQLIFVWVEYDGSSGDPSTYTSYILKERVKNGSLGSTTTIFDGSTTTKIFGLSGLISVPVAIAVPAPTIQGIYSIQF